MDKILKITYSLNKMWTMVVLHEQYAKSEECDANNTRFHISKYGKFYIPHMYSDIQAHFTLMKFVHGLKKCS